jgi:hypothetical protein
VSCKSKTIKAPFQYPGGKSKVASIVWERFGDVSNYIEPFMGSLAVMLRRPASHFVNGYRVETCNDVNHFIVNFWRAIRAAPDEVAQWADSPVLEADLHARHKWLMRSETSKEWRKRMAEDPEHFDAKIAGWWVWGACCWIGGGWCSNDTDILQRPDIAGSNYGPNNAGVLKLKTDGPRPQLADAYDIGRGVHASGSTDSVRRIASQPGGLGHGIHASGESRQIPQLRGDSGAFGSGVHSSSWQHLSQKIPDMDGGRGEYTSSAGGTCEARLEWLTRWFRQLADRLRLVRTCYGHWSRICDSDSTLTRLGTTGVFLDPPYPSHREDTGEKSRDATLYASDKGSDLNALRDEVRNWCIKWSGNPEIKIAVCGYEGDGYEVLVSEHGWEEHAWEASGGYGNQRKKKGQSKSENAKRERIWFSPSCIKAQPTLFDTLTAEMEQ